MVEEKLLKNPSDIADYLNNKYSKTAKEIGVRPSIHDALNLAKNVRFICPLRFNFKFVTAGDVSKVLRSLKIKIQQVVIKYLLI